MNEHVTRERMNDLFDGLLTAAESNRVRAHVAECDACRREHEALAEVVGTLRTLPGNAALPRDLWDGIAGRLTAREPEEPQMAGAGADELPSGRLARRRIDLSVMQAVAAMILVSVLSAGTMWWATTGGRESASGPGRMVAGAPVAERVVTAVGSVEYQEAVARLENVIEQGRDALAPETLETLRQSLETIERALAEVRDALAADPSSETLARMLVNHQQSKLRLLRQAAVSVQAAT